MLWKGDTVGFLSFVNGSSGAQCCRVAETLKPNSDSISPVVYAANAADIEVRDLAIEGRGEDPAPFAGGYGASAVNPYLAFETLAVLSGTADLGSVMTSVQLYTFAIVSILFIPCISTVAVLYKQLGAKIAILTSAYSLFLGLLIGVLINILMK